MKWLIFLLVMVLFIAVGCNGTRSDAIGPEFKDYKSGVKELKIIDGESTFPKLRHQNSILKGTFRLHNQAAYEITGVKVALLGLDREYVKIEDNQRVKEVDFIDGRGFTNDEGGKVDVEFQGLVSQLPPGTGNLPLNYFINVKYNSKVEFSPSICVDSGLYHLGGCEGTSLSNPKKDLRPKTYSGQGAPLAVTFLEVIPYGTTDSDVEFRMTLRHVGSSYGQIRRVTLNKAALANNGLSCVFKGGDVENSRSILMPDAQEVDLVCNGRIQSQAPYKSPLYLEIFYEYDLKVPRTLELKGSAIRS